MSIDHPAIAKLKAQFPKVAFKGAQFHGDTQIIVPREALREVVGFLKDEPTLNYNMLCDVSCVDYLNYPGAPKDGRFGMVYVFNSVPATPGGAAAPRLILRVFLDETKGADGAVAAPEVDSLVPLYFGAEWVEREVFDMFGIRFKDHPDLRRILTWDGFKAHPLRKDYPITGKGEREQYPILSRDSA